MPDARRFLQVGWPGGKSGIHRIERIGEMGDEGRRRAYEGCGKPATPPWRPSIAQGWQCPVCKSVWAPGFPGCSRCNQEALREVEEEKSLEHP